MLYTLAMPLSEYEYKVLDLTNTLANPVKVNGSLADYAQLGWDVQQVFTRWVGNDTEFAYALLRKPRGK